jgi:hypothetical protein
MNCEDYYINKFLSDIEFCSRHVERDPLYVKKIINQYVNFNQINECDIRVVLEMMSQICLDNPKKVKKMCLYLLQSLQGEKLICE